MELQEFIETTIKQITTGLSNSHNEMIKHKVGKGIPSNHTVKVDFDVLVSASLENETGASGKISVVGFGIGIEGSKNEKNNLNSNSRIRFSVPVFLNTPLTSDSTYL